MREKGIVDNGCGGRALPRKIRSRFLPRSLKRDFVYSLTGREYFPTGFSMLRASCEYQAK